MNAKIDDKPQLQMVWRPGEPTVLSHQRRHQDADRIELHTAPGYTIRTYHPGDEPAFLSLMATGDFDPWDEKKLHDNMAKIIPEGWFFAVDERSDQIVGTAMCLHNYSGETPFTGDVGWVACDPAHRGKGLGYSLTASVTNRFLSAGYSLIQLHTEHYRLPAVKTYLKLGYAPLLGLEGAYALWQELCQQVGWPFTPDSWPHGT